MEEDILILREFGGKSSKFIIYNSSFHLLLDLVLLLFYFEIILIRVRDFIQQVYSSDLSF